MFFCGPRITEKGSPPKNDITAIFDDLMCSRVKDFFKILYCMNTTSIQFTYYFLLFKTDKPH